MNFFGDIDLRMQNTLEHFIGNIGIVKVETIIFSGDLKVI